MQNLPPPRLSACTRPRRAAVLATLAMAMMLPRPVAAQEWSTQSGTAVARLPPPNAASGVSGGEMRCAEQRWSLLLLLAPGIGGTIAAGSARPVAALTVGTLTVEARAAMAAEDFSIPVASELIEPLKAGARLAIEVSETEPPLSAEFSLRGSRRAIEAAEPECSPRDMSAYDRVVLSEKSPFMPAARDLRADEIATFRTATASEPSIAAASVDLGGGHRLLFTAICGSSWYYGRSGCNMAGFAAKASDDDWSLVYDTEGVELYVDRTSATERWPDLVTLPLRGGGDELRWTWSDGRYVLFEPEEPGEMAEAPTGGEKPARP